MVVLAERPGGAFSKSNDKGIKTTFSKHRVGDWVNSRAKKSTLVTKIKVAKKNTVQEFPGISLRWLVS